MSSIHSGPPHDAQNLDIKKNKAHTKHAHTNATAQRHASASSGRLLAWRLAPAASLFDYAVGTSAATYRTPHYLDMPVGAPPVQLNWRTFLAFRGR